MEEGSRYNKGTSREEKVWVYPPRKQSQDDGEQEKGH